MPAHGLTTRPQVVLTPSSTSGYNVKTAAGSVAAMTDVVVVVGTGVALSQGLRTGGAWPTACTITIKVTSGGIICGAGGHGSAGANNDDVAGSNGGAGGDGILIEDNVRTYVEITGTGIVAGGGGGGGGGGASQGPPYPAYPGGGGGGGRGYPGGAHGDGGVDGSSHGSPGQDGTTSGSGLGGDGYAGGGFSGAAGGAGGDWGVDGDPAQYKADCSAQGAGGPAGAAIRSTGYLPAIILAGNDAAHLKGAVVT
jgi:hypothetical protein